MSAEISVRKALEEMRLCRVEIQALMETATIRNIIHVRWNWMPSLPEAWVLPLISEGHKGL